MSNENTYHDDDLLGILSDELEAVMREKLALAEQNAALERRISAAESQAVALESALASATEDKSRLERERDYAIIERDQAKIEAYDWMNNVRKNVAKALPQAQTITDEGSIIWAENLAEPAVAPAAAEPEPEKGGGVFGKLKFKKQGKAEPDAAFEPAPAPVAPPVENAPTPPVGFSAAVTSPIGAASPAPAPYMGPEGYDFADDQATVVQTSSPLVKVGKVALILLALLLVGVTTTIIALAFMMEVSILEAPALLISMIAGS